MNQREDSSARAQRLARIIIQEIEAYNPALAEEALRLGCFELFFAQELEDGRNAVRTRAPDAPQDYLDEALQEFLAKHQLASAQHDTRRRLLSSVLEAPQDTGRRHVMADWLIAQGDPRGEFISVQCALHDTTLDAKRRAALEKRERVLLSKHERLWTAPVSHIAKRWRFSRGFIEGLTVDVSVLLSPRKLPTQLEPIQRLKILGLNSESLALIVDLPVLHEMIGLELCGPIGDEGAQVLARSDQLSALERLVLDECDISDRGACALVRAPALAGLRVLSLQRNPDILRPMELAKDGLELIF